MLDAAPKSYNIKENPASYSGVILVKCWDIN